MKGTLAILFIVVCFAMVLPQAAGDTIVVDDDGGAWADYSNIQEAVNASSEGDVIRIFNGTYSSHIEIEINVSLIGNGTNETRIVRNWTNHVIFNVNHHNVTISDMMLTDVTGDHSTGIYLYGEPPDEIVNDLTVERVLFENLTIGITISGSSNNRIENCTFIDEEIAVNIDWSTNNYYRNNTMINCGLEFAGYGVKDQKFEYMDHDIDTSNTANGRPVVYIKDQVGGSIPTDPGQVIVFNSTDIKIENLNITDATGGIYVGYSDRISISNNTLIDNRLAGIFVITLNDSLIHNNTIIGSIGVGNRYGTGLKLTTYCNNNTVSGNTISNSNDQGLALTGLGTNNRILSNHVYMNGGAGIGISYSHNNMIFDNICDSNLIGVGMSDSSYNNATNNTCTHNEESGISVFRDAHWNVVFDNVVMNNDRYGIVIDGLEHLPSGNNSVIHNQILKNQNYGLAVFEKPTKEVSFNSTIYDNIFWKNGKPTSQGYDDGVNSAWDNGTTGNYWHDYKGRDADHDGIGDSAYDIDGNANVQDRYPLMYPWKGSLIPFTWIVDDNWGSWWDFDSIQDAVDASSDGDTIRVYSGYYDEAIVLDNQLSIIGNGSNSTTIHGDVNDGNQTGDNYNTITIEADYCILSDLFISYSGSEEYSAGIGVFADEIQLTNIELRHNRFGIYINGSNNVSISNFDIQDNTAAIRIYDSSNVTIDSFQISINQSYNRSAQEQTIIIERSTNLSVMSTTGHYLRFVRCEDVSVEESTIEHMWLQTSYWVTISHCVLVNDDGIIMQDGGMIDIDRVTVRNSIDDGISVGDGARKIRITNSTISNCTNTGILLSIDTEDVSIIDCTISKCGDDGINLRMDVVTISNVTISDCNRSIIRIDGDDCEISNGSFSNCSGTIQVLLDGNGNMIKDSEFFVDDSYGIYLTNICDDTEIYHNNFHSLSNSTTFVYQENGTYNLWDNGSAGNYWSDYDGSDDDGDGIGDTPYYMGGTGNGTDRYPLMDPWNGSIDRSGNGSGNQTQNPALIIVDDDGGRWADYTRVPDAIENANENDRILIYDGYYSIDSLEINRTLELIGNGSADTMLSGQMTFTDNSIRVSNLTISATGGHGDYGLVIHSDSNIVEHIRIQKFGRGIYLLNEAQDNEIRDTYLFDNNRGVVISRSYGNRLVNNTIDESVIGIELERSERTVIRNNNFVYGSGIYIHGDRLSHWNTHWIDDSNVVQGHRIHYISNATNLEINGTYGQVILVNSSQVSIKKCKINGSSIGIQLGFSTNNTIMKNEITWQYYYDIFLYRSDRNIIQDNLMKKNYHNGIHIKDSSDNHINDNAFITFYDFGLWLDNCTSTTINNNTFRPYVDFDLAIQLEVTNSSVITHNNFKAGSGTVIDIAPSCYQNVLHHNNFPYGESVHDYEGNSTWDDGSEGNYWSSYGGKDSNNDGIGDTPFYIDNSTGSVDYFPLMEPNGSRTNVSTPRTWTVDDDNGSWADFRSITNAVAAASSGDTLRIYSGIYREHFVLDRSLKLIGNGSSSRIIGWKNGTTVMIDADYCTISNLNFSKDEVFYQATTFDTYADLRRGPVGVVNLNVNNCSMSSRNLAVFKYVNESRFENNYLYGYTFGIEIQFSNSWLIQDNIFVNGSNGHGPLYIEESEDINIYSNQMDNVNTSVITLDNCRSSFISFNTISNCTRDGIHITYGSDTILISNNSITGSGRYGIWIRYSSNATVMNNIVKNGTGIGVLVTGASNENWAHDNTIYHNYISSNSGPGIVLHSLGSSADYLFHNQIYRNLIIDNNVSGVQAKCNVEDNYWDNGSLGNYWSDYNGTDIDGDGIGETPYYINGDVNAIDRYPLTETFASSNGIDIELSNISFDGYLVDGETITVTISLGTHSGIPHESNITIRLKVLLDGDEVQNFTQDLTIDSGYSNLTFDHNITLNGTGDFTFEAEIVHDNETIVSDSTSVTTSEAVYSFSLVLDRLTPGADPGDDIEYELEVKNSGNVPQTIRLSCSKGWINFSKTTLFIHPDGSGYSTITASIPSDATGSVNFTIVAKSYDKDNDIVNSGNAPVTITLDDESEDDDPERIVWVFVGAGIMIGAGILIGTEIGLYALMTLFMPLYSRVKGEKVLDNFVRGQIYGYVVANPGASFNQIRKALSLHNGQFAYHVQVLGREKYIRIQRDGIYTRFYPAPMNGGAIPVTGMRADIFHVIRENPGISQKEIAKTLGISNQLVSYHVMRLRERKLLKVKQKGRRSLLFERKRHAKVVDDDMDFMEDDIVGEEGPVMGSIPVDPLDTDEENT